MVLMITRADKRGLEEQIGEPSKFFQRCRQFLIAPLRRLLRFGFDLPLDTRERIAGGGQFRRGAGADVVTDNTAIDALGACVVASLSSACFPAHLRFLSTPGAKATSHWNPGRRRPALTVHVLSILSASFPPVGF